MRAIFEFFGSQEFWSDRRGVTWIYVTITASALFGFAALVIDFTRYDVTHSQARTAAEAVALAAATQLNGRADSITRACNAINTALVANDQTLGTNPGSVTIDRVRFLDGLPDGDPTLPEDPSVLDPFVVADTVGDATCTNTGNADAPFRARFVEVTSQNIAVNTFFVQVVSGNQGATTRASAVAGYTQVLCRRAPLAICNPAEIPGQEDIRNISFWKGRQILIKGRSGGCEDPPCGPDEDSGAAWVPGDFSLVDIAGVQKTGEIWRALAEGEPDVCIEAKINLKPGQVQGARSALNVRFGMYDGKMWGGGNEWTKPKYRPAKNTTKGYLQLDAADACNYSVNDDPSVPSMSFPQDDSGMDQYGNSNLPGDGINETYRVGDGKWDCKTYWNRMHPGDQIGVGDTKIIKAALTEDNDTGLEGQSLGEDLVCGDVNQTTASRYDVYRHEINASPASNEYIPDTRDVDAEGNPIGDTGENGDPKKGPQCYTGGDGTLTDPADATGIDRRIVTFAVIDCKALDDAGYSLSGNSGGVLPVTAFIDGFLTQPLKPISDNKEGASIYLEIVDVVDNKDGALHDIVQLYR